MDAPAGIGRAHHRGVLLAVGADIEAHDVAGDQRDDVRVGGRAARRGGRRAARRARRRPGSAATGVASPASRARAATGAKVRRQRRTARIENPSDRQAGMRVTVLTPNRRSQSITAAESSHVRSSSHARSPRSGNSRRRHDAESCSIAKASGPRRRGATPAGRPGNGCARPVPRAVPTSADRVSGR